MTLPAWRSMLKGLEGQAEDADPTEEDPDFVDWFSSEAMFGRIVDASLRRHWIDPTVPLEAAVIAPAHGVLVTSATLTDPVFDDPFELARLRTGSARLAEPPREVRVESPFDYASNARVFVVGDVGRDDPRQVAAAMRELFLASGGGALGLFTAIGACAPPTSFWARPWPRRDCRSTPSTSIRWRSGPWSTSSAPRRTRACSAPTPSAMGWMVPGRALRLIAFDRVPWPRPDILHKARRARFGGKAYDDAVARGRVAQAFGRLIRREDDKGVFVLLDAAAPTRLFGQPAAGHRDPPAGSGGSPSRRFRPS